MDKLFEMMNQEIMAKGTKYQVLPNLGFVVGSQSGSKLRVFEHVHASEPIRTTLVDTPYGDGVLC